MRTATRRWVVAAALLFTLLSTVSGAAPRRLEPGDLASIVRLGDTQLSPDGTAIVFVVGTPNVIDARYDNALVLLDIASGSQRVLTYRRNRVGAPRWSPSGDRIAFLDSVAGETESAQVFVMPMRGGDAQPITRAVHDVERFSWSPDGTQIVYAMADDDPHRDDVRRHSDAFEVANNGYLATAAQMPSHLWLVPATGGTARRITSGTWTIAATPSWAPDGRSIAIVQQASANLGDEDQSVVATLDVATGEIRKLTGHKAYEDQPVYSPDGLSLAYFYPRDGAWGDVNGLFVTSSAGGDGVDVTRLLDRNTHRAIWFADGQSLLIGAHSGTRTLLWRQLRNNGTAMPLDLGELEPSLGSVALAKDGAMAMVAATPTRPDEIYHLPGNGGPPRRLTDFNHEIASLDLGRAEPFSWKGPNGWAEDGVVVYPPGFKPDRKYPLVLLIHGGPDGASTVEFDAAAQLLAARDYIVFMPNYRGSDNQGNAFQRAIYHDAGEGPGRDVMAGLAALQRKAFIDRNRIAVSGWSYGGYLTAWLIGHSHSWKAAVVGSAPTDLVHTYNLSDLNLTLRYNFGGSPWTGNRMNAYQQQSPISYAGQITTPTLILADTFDARVPITQSYLLYHALKDNGVPVQFFAYPVRDHFPGDPVRAPDVYRRWIDWLDRYLRTP